MTTLKSNQSGGYDYEFVHTPADTLICKICHFPSKEPHLSACCGHTFCKTCIEAANSSTLVSNACPMCRGEEFVTFHNKQTDRIIRSLHVYCSNKKKGCEWQGEVNAITSHLNNRDGCQLQEVNCPNDCGVAYQRQYLTSHVETECPRRKVNCQYCHDTGEHQFIEGQHKEECAKLPLPCPNKCGVDNIPRDGLSEHINLCPLQLVQCKYHIVGCEAMMARKDQEKHNKEMMEEHLSLSVTELVILMGKNEKDPREHQHLSAGQIDVQKPVGDLTQEHATAEKEITALKQQPVALTDNSDKLLVEAGMKFQSEQNAEEMKIVLQEATTIKEKLAQELSAHQVNAMATQQQLLTSQNKIKQNLNLLQGLMVGLAGLMLALMCSLYFQHNELTILKTELKTINENEMKTRTQLPFLCHFSAYTEYRKELIIKEENSLSELASGRSAPVIVKMSGISSTLKTMDSFSQESSPIYIEKNVPINLFLWKFNNTHMEFILYMEPSVSKELLWLAKFTVTIMNQLNNSDHHTLDLDEDTVSYLFTKKGVIGPVYAFSQFISFEYIFTITPIHQYIVCNSIFFSIDHPDFYENNDE